MDAKPNYAQNVMSVIDAVERRTNGRGTRWHMQVARQGLDVGLTVEQILFLLEAVESEAKYEFLFLVLRSAPGQFASMQ